MKANVLPSSLPLKSSFPFKRPTILSTSPLYLRVAAAGPAANSGSESSKNDDETKATAAETRPPPNTFNIRYRARSKKQARRQQQQQQQESIKAPPPPKDWETMTLAEKAVELYVGEKGLLFWLNKFAYASIFIIIGGWILFRFVGPSLGLYQLDAPPLSPTSILKGSS